MNKLILLASFALAKIAGTLPAGKWRLSRRDYNGSPTEWAMIAPVGAPDEDGNRAVHVLQPGNGLWDAEQRAYICPLTGRELR